MAARIAKGMTQEDVQRECAARDVPVWNLSRMESGELRWPHPRIALIITEVLDLTFEELFEAAA